MTTGSRSTVHVAGHYVTSTAGFDALAEVRLFREMFWKSNEANGYASSFLMEMDGDPKLTRTYVRLNVKEGDVFVLLNPTGDMSLFTVRTEYLVIVKMVSALLGRARLVLAFQDREIKKRNLTIQQSTLWSINYAPFVDVHEELVFPEPAPEEAIIIVARIIRGENPDIHARPV